MKNQKKNKDFVLYFDFEDLTDEQLAQLEELKQDLEYKIEHIIKGL